ncbi:response regulator transcription factor [Paenibacillus alginolyticus]|uniref:Response regulator n=2 Tax=Paenibacillus alginolyticus TaxID=59839 RepID=A0ABT4GQ29_9BACL|nr:response regulator [Paenibacillus alginolyticus]MCY9698166.1 response regulator [Paenibacillus alginolyticus]
MYKVLLIEDEDQIRLGLKKLIEDIIGGFKVVKEAENGLKALDFIQTDIPDVIITDIRMNGMNGIELIKRVRDQFPNIFILVISGYGDFEYTKKAIQYRVDNYLLKPIDRIELTQCLTRIKEKLDLYKKQNVREGKSTHTEASEEMEIKIIRKVKEIIHSNLDQDISLQFIANKIHLNRQYLSFLFKVQTGQNFVDYVIQCRMERAKQLLRDTNLKIYEIAKLSGYENPKYFMTVFKQYAGGTPSEFRENCDLHWEDVLKK